MFNKKLNVGQGEIVVMKMAEKFVKYYCQDKGITFKDIISQNIEYQIQTGDNRKHLILQIRFISIHLEFKISFKIVLNHQGNHGMLSIEKTDVLNVYEGIIGRNNMEKVKIDSNTFGICTFNGKIKFTSPSREFESI